MKICSDCKHHVATERGPRSLIALQVGRPDPETGEQVYHECRHPAARGLVTGQIIGVSCHGMRTNHTTDVVERYCGIAGDLWEPKPPIA